MKIAGRVRLREHTTLARLASTEPAMKIAGRHGSPNSFPSGKTSFNGAGDEDRRKERRTKLFVFRAQLLQRSRR